MTEAYQGPTPPPELVQRWRNAAPPLGLNRESWIATAAARWGADQELEACCAWLEQNCGRWELPGALRTARRPKPPSLAEEALEAMRSMQIEPCRINGITVNAELISKYDTIRRALERLQEMEGGDD